MADAGVVRNPYENDDLVAQYCEFHYGDDYFGVSNFPALCAELCIRFMAGRKKEQALDVGCAVGRTSFELAREFDAVTGVDFSRRFIEVACTMRDEGRITYDLPIEGELAVRAERTLAGIGLASVGSRVEFRPSDALALPEELTGYDLVFAGNLIDRLATPRRFLTAIHERLVPNGLLVLASPYTWLTEFTPRAEWLGGFENDAGPFTSLDGLADILIPCFRMADEPRDVPFVIRETARKYQHSIAQMTVWERC